MAAGPVLQKAPDLIKQGVGQESFEGKRPDYTVALATLTMLFFMMGFITCMNDIIIPYFKSIFSLNFTQAMMVQFCFFSAYFVMSIPSGYLIQRTGYKKAIILGFIIAAFGCLLFYPSADLQSYPLFLGAFFILATGIVLLQVAGNPYVAILGKPETASARLTLTQAFNSVGTTIAPIIGSSLILSKLNTNPGDATAVQMPYLVFCGIMVTIAIIISMIKLPVLQPESNTVTEKKGESKSAWSYKHLRFGALAIFTYVGAEVAIGSFMVNYFNLPSLGGLDEESAGHLLTYYWGGAMVGRFIGAGLLRVIKPWKILTFNSAVTIALVVTSILTSGTIAMWSLILVGLFNSVMFATIFTLAVDNLGKHTNQGSGILCTAIVGGAVIPLMQGLVADSIGLNLAFIIPILCYAYIAWYGFIGHKQKLA
jgi:MFS transporter, FHS family, L-fucose permease